MIIETTININIYKLSMASMITRRSKRYIISSLLRRLSYDHDKIALSWVRVKYQMRDVQEHWRCLHLALTPDEYEFFIDLRKVCKQSLSRLINYAVEKYLDGLINRIKECTDNYQYRNYAFSRITIDGVVCLIHYWGIPTTFICRPIKS